MKLIIVILRREQRSSIWNFKQSKHFKQEIQLYSIVHAPLHLQM